MASTLCCLASFLVLTSGSRPLSTRSVPHVSPSVPRVSHHVLPSLRRTSLSTHQSWAIRPPPLRRRMGRGDMRIGFGPSPAPADAIISGEEVPARKMLTSLFKEFWPKSSLLRFNVLVAVGLLILAKVVNVQVPILFKHMIDVLSESMMLSQQDKVAALPVAFLVAYGVARVLGSLFNELRTLLFARVCQDGIRGMSKATLSHVLDMDYDFHVNRQSGALSKAIDRGHRSLDFAIRAIIFTIVPTILEAVLVGRILAEKCGLLFMGVTVATMTSYLLYTLAITQWRTKYYKKTNDLDNQASSASFDSLLNYETVKYFNNENLELDRYNKILKEKQSFYLKSTWSLGLLNFGQSLIFSGGLSIALALSASMILSGRATLGDIVMIHAQLIQLSMPLQWLGSLYRELRQSLVDMATIFKLRNVRRDIHESDMRPKELNVSNGTIEFKGVRFGYGNSTREVFKDLNLKIPGGARVGIVGSTGSGKSTILRMLFRFYDPRAGSIRIDGQDIKNVSMASLRQNVGVVPQDVVLFNDDIMYNLRYAKLDASDEEVIQAAKDAQVHDAIMRMPEGYQTKVGERGLKLSGGEKQRLGIARLLLKNPKIVVFDEATSSVDMQTERKLMSALDAATNKRTTITVAHRLATIKNCDKIVVLENGTIAQEGTHEGLISQPGLYGRLWAEQAPSAAAIPESSDTDTLSDLEVERRVDIDAAAEGRLDPALVRARRR
ncbi:hypothetical protein AAMO2058_000198000 [Amorphochlora amoebiformis]